MPWTGQASIISLGSLGSIPMATELTCGGAARGVYLAGGLVPAIRRGCPRELARVWHARGPLACAPATPTTTDLGVRSALGPVGTRLMHRRHDWLP